MDIWHYDPATGELLAKGSAKPDPLEEGRFLMPAYASGVEPPAAPSDKVAVYEAGAWTLVDDLRGTTYWMTGVEHRQKDLGPLPAGATTTPPGDYEVWDEAAGAWRLDIDAARAAGTAMIDTAAEAARLAFITGGAGQMLVYDRKERQARDCLASHDAASPPPAGKYPALEAEVGITAADILGVAGVVAEKADAWATIGDQIEAVRLGRKAEVAAATDAAGVEAAVAAAQADLDAIEAQA